MSPRFALRSVFVALVCAACLTGRLHGADKPNIVMIFIDDMGYGDIGPFGSTKNRTPCLDRMAKEGMKFTNFYAAPVCSVSRAQVMTGCYGVRVSVPGVFSPCSRQGLNPEERTVAELLKEQGYATMCIGKWHLGDQKVFLPTRQGFDHYLGIPYSNDMNKPSAGNSVPVVPLLRDEKVEELLDAEGQNKVTERYTEEAVKFIREHKDIPFSRPKAPGSPLRAVEARACTADVGHGHEGRGGEGASSLPPRQRHR